MANENINQSIENDEVNQSIDDSTENDVNMCIEEVLMCFGENPKNDKKSTVKDEKSDVEGKKILYLFSHNFKGFYTKIEFFRTFSKEKASIDDGQMYLDALRIGGLENLVPDKSVTTSFSDGFETLKNSFQNVGGEIGTDIADNFSDIDKTSTVLDKMNSAIKSVKSTVTNVGNAFSSIVNTVLLKGLIGNIPTKQEQLNNILTHIILPLPNQLPADDISIDWTEEDMGVLGTLWDKNQTTNAGGKVVIGKLAEKMFEKIFGGDSNIMGELASTLGNAQKIRLANKGIRLGGESDMVLYKSTKRRSINLEWNFIANTQEEQIAFLNICNRIKMHTNASNSSSDFGTVYPSYVRVKVYLKDTLYYYISEGVIQNYSFDMPQASNGLWRYDGKPHEVSLKLSILERRRLYAEDFGYTDSAILGYENEANLKDKGNRSEETGYFIPKFYTEIKK